MEIKGKYFYARLNSEFRITIKAEKIGPEEFLELLEELENIAILLQASSL